MAVTIKEVKRESCPATRLIGKKYEQGPNWVNGGRMIGFLF